MHSKFDVKDSCCAVPTNELCVSGQVPDVAQAVAEVPRSTAHLRTPGAPKVAAFSVAETGTHSEVQKLVTDESSEHQNSLPLVGEQHVPMQAPQLVVAENELAFGLNRKLDLIKDGLGDVYLARREGGNPIAYRLGSNKANALIAQCAREAGAMPRSKEIAEINELLKGHAEQAAVTTDVWYRVAKVEGGIELDVGDEANTRIRITAGKVEVLTSGSEVVFTRNATLKPMVLPASEGDLRTLKRYLNVSAPEQLLLIAWVIYTMAQPKGGRSKYVFLVLSGNEGSGKSNLSKLLLRLIDPGAIGVQTFPASSKDLAIAGRHAHVLAFDNLRSFKDHMADMLCVASTGGSLTSRKLYSDADQQAIPLHVALVLNGIHSFIDQPDLAQRCLPIHLLPIDPLKRKPEEVMDAELEADLPKIMRGLFDLVAKVLEQLPEAVVTKPERMVEFSRWLAAMERVEGIPAGIYQDEYSIALRQGQLDTMMDNPLAAAIIQFVDELDGTVWSGTPTELHDQLSRRVGLSTQRSREWPQNPIALSKRIAGLQAGLRSQDIRIELTRGKERIVTISKVGG